MAGIDKKLSELSVKVDGVKDSLTDREKDHADHEARIRSLELTQAGMIAASTKTTGVWQWVWAAGLGLMMLTVSILNYLK